jgi:FkbM family methyltransferase
MTYLRRAAKRALPFLPSWRRRVEKQLEMFSAESRQVGQSAAVRLLAARTLGPIPRWLKFGRLASVRITGFPSPVFFRDQSSDPLAIHQVFALREYEVLTGERDVRFILDLGANIGCATLFLLRHHPEASVVVVEPDPANMAVCRRNLAAFGDRVRFVQAGVWSQSVPMVVSRGEYRDGAEWSFQVRPARPGESPEFQAKTVAELIADAGFPRVDILKMDIEAAEAEVFRTGSDEWLPRVRTLIVEFHGTECEAAAATALSRYRHVRERSGENVLYRMAPPVAAGA